jgi:hypothetical protein
MAQPTQQIEGYSLMDGVTEAFQSLPTGDIKAVAEKFMKKLENEFSADPIHMIHQAALLGAGLNSLTAERLGQGASYLAKLAAWKALSGMEAPGGQSKAKAAPKQINDSEQEARHAS